MEPIGTQEIKTKRLLLRQFTMDDVQEVYDNYGSDPKVQRYISYMPCSDLEFAEEYLALHVRFYETNPEFFAWAITLDGVVIGNIGLFHVGDADDCELSYQIGSKWWGNGYATEATKAVVDYAFTKVKMHRVYATHHVENLASENVLKKLGMVFEGVLRDGQKNVDDTYSDLKLHAILNNA